MNKAALAVIVLFNSVCFSGTSDSMHKEFPNDAFVQQMQKSSTIDVSKIGGKIEIDTKDSAIDKHLPWISALLVGLGSVFVSWIVGARQVKASNAQINSSVNVAKTQIEQASQSTIQTLRANIVSANRQNWINELRDLYARFIVASGRLVMETLKNQRTPEPERLLSPEMIEIFKEMKYCASKIDLMLNPKEALSMTVLTNIDLVIEFAQKGKSSDVVEKLGETSTAMKSIFRAEWLKIKALE